MLFCKGSLEVKFSQAFQHRDAKDNRRQGRNRSKCFDFPTTTTTTTTNKYKYAQMASLCWGSVAAHRMQTLVNLQLKKNANPQRSIGPSAQLKNLAPFCRERRRMLLPRTPRNRQRKTFAHADCAIFRVSTSVATASVTPAWIKVLVPLEQHLWRLGRFVCVFPFLVGKSGFPVMSLVLLLVLSTVIPSVFGFAPIERGCPTSTTDHGRESCFCTSGAIAVQRREALQVCGRFTCNLVASQSFYHAEMHHAQKIQ